MVNITANVIEMQGIGNLPIFRENGELDFTAILPVPKEVSAGPAEIRHDWMRRNWGAASQAHNTVSEADLVGFVTEDDPPLLIPQHLSAMFPKAKIRMYWADELTLYARGYADFLAGEFLSAHTAMKNSDEAHTISSYCWAHVAKTFHPLAHCFQIPKRRRPRTQTWRVPAAAGAARKKAAAVPVKP